MTKIAGSGSISQRHGSADPDQNVTDPQHCQCCSMHVRVGSTCLRACFRAFLLLYSLFFYLSLLYCYKSVRFCLIYMSFPFRHYSVGTGTGQLQACLLFPLFILSCIVPNQSIPLICAIQAAPSFPSPRGGCTKYLHTVCRVQSCVWRLPKY